MVHAPSGWRTRTELFPLTLSSLFSLFVCLRLAFVSLPQGTLNPLYPVSPVLYSFHRLSLTACLSFLSVLIPTVTSASESLTFLSNILIVAFCAHVFHLFILTPTLSSLKATEKGLNGGIPGRMMGQVKAIYLPLTSGSFLLPNLAACHRDHLQGLWAEGALSFPGLCWHSGGLGSPNLN